MPGLIPVILPVARVIGVHGVRVVDASAFPLLPPGHPQASVCRLYLSTDNGILLIGEDALAEKIADIIISQGSNSLESADYTSSMDKRATI